MDNGGQGCGGSGAGLGAQALPDPARHSQTASQKKKTPIPGFEGNERGNGAGPQRSRPLRGAGNAREKKEGKAAGSGRAGAGGTGGHGALIGAGSVN